MSIKNHKEEIEKDITKQIKKGIKIIEDTDNLSPPEFEKSFTLWADFTTDMLKSHFDEETVNSFKLIVHPSVYVISSGIDVNHYIDQINKGITSLESIRNRLNYLIKDKIEIAKEKTYSRKVFIVHGHDDLLKEKVSRCIKNLKLIPIILHEQPSKGKTIIEKFEENSDVDYAIILLTPDDVGGIKDIKKFEDLKPRARQNVIFELGFFMGKLGRDRLCAIKKGNQEILSDFSGVEYISTDEENWMIGLIKELKSAGIPMDTKGFFSQ